MDKTTIGQILVGSATKAIKNSKLTGYLNTKEILFFNIIGKLKQYCELNFSSSEAEHLNKILRDLQNKYESICNYRKKNNTFTFIKDEPANDYNSVNNNDVQPPSVEGYDCYDYEYMQFNFVEDIFLTNYSGDSDPKYLRIKSLPAQGSLKYNGINVVIDQIILLSDVSNLTYDLESTYSNSLNISFDYQIGDSKLNTLFSNTVSFIICIPEKRNQAPTVQDESGDLNENNCRVFVYDDFTNEFADPDEGDIPYEVRIVSLPTIGTLRYDNETFTVPFEFNIANVNNLKFCLPDNESIIDGRIYRYDEPLNDQLNDLFNQGYTITDVTNGDYELTKIEETTVTNTTNIYAIFDATSMTPQDGLDAKTALQSWFDNFNLQNEDYTGNLYIIPLYNEKWLSYGSMPWTGQFGIPVTTNNWGNISVLPPNINSGSWVPDTDAMVLAFVDESFMDYHSNFISDGFGGSVTQPTTNYVDDFVEFKNIYNNYNFFRGLMYPIVKDNTEQGECLVLQMMAALNGTTLTPVEIESYNTQVDVNLLLTENPYENFPIPGTSPQEFLEPLKDYNWGGVFDKTSPASEVFSSNQFSNDLDLFLQSTTNTTTDTVTINGTLVSSSPITFDFQTSDDDEEEQLFSNVATYTINYGNLSNQPPNQVGDGSKNIYSNQIITFTRSDLTSLLEPSYMDPENDPAFKLLVVSLPDKGTLTLNGNNVTAGQEILFTDIDSGLFKYIPDVDSGNYNTIFNFKISDTGSGQFV